MIGSSIGPYDIVERLGAGGMGEVYLARDRRLNRHVALKSLSDPSLDIPEARDRLLQEARAAARLTHPNIAAIHDILDSGTPPCIVMEYVQGETLSAALAHGPMPPARAVAVGIQLADALAHAHASGVVHRDLKPANVIVTADGTAKILDFGVARIREIPPDDGTASTLRDVTRTQTGVVAGTPSYMAPEQLMGRAASARSDIYSLGTLLFELLTGRRPFAGGDFMAIALAIAGGPTPLARDANPAVPEDVSAIVARAMAKEPAERYQSASEMKAALQRAARGLTEQPTMDVAAFGDAVSGKAGVRPYPVTAVVRGRWFTRRRLVAVSSLVLAVAALVLWVTALRPRAESPVVGILPFSGENQADDYLGADISDSLIASLVCVRPVTVVSGEETGRYRGVPQDARRIAGRHGATLLVAGGVREAGDRVSFSVKLLMPDGRVVWSNTYEGRKDDLFTLQNDAARELVAALGVPVSPDDQQRLERQRTRSFDAYADYSLGRAMLNRYDVGDNIEKALEAFTRATTKDPDFAAAHAALGEAYWRLYGRSRDIQWVQPGIAAVQKALTLAPDDPAALLMLATIHLRAPGVTGPEKYNQAIEEIRKALAAQPNSDQAHRLMAEIHAAQHRSEDAIKEYRQAIAIRPGYFQNYISLGNFYYFAGRREEAKIEYERAIAKQPDSPFALANVGVSYLAAGDYQRAIEYSQRALNVDPKFDVAWSNIGTALYELGRFPEAVEAFKKAVALQDHNATSHRNLGDTYLRVGDRDNARQEYRRAAELTDEQLRVNPKDARLEASHALYSAKAGEFGDVVMHVEHATAMAPSDNEVLYKSAVVYALAGKRDEAIKSLQRAVAAGYNVARARRDDDLASVAKLPQVQALLRDSR